MKIPIAIDPRNYLAFFALVALFFISLPNSTIAQHNYTLLSPDKQVKVTLTITDSIRYELFHGDRSIIPPSVIALDIDNRSSAHIKVKRDKRNTVKQTLYPVVWQKTDHIDDIYNELRIELEHDLALEWRAYDNGAAWRWVSSRKNSYQVFAEKAAFNFNQGDTTWYPLETSFISHNERVYKQLSVDSLGGKLASLPVLFNSKGLNVLITESNLFNYAGMWLRGNHNNGVDAVFPYYPKQAKETSDRDKPVTQREDYIARIDGTHNFPWRIIMLEKDDKGLLTNQLPYQLGRPASGDFSWVKGGKVVWDWWNNWNLSGVDFRSGPNTDTYKYYIDFAAHYQIPYFVLDEGWGNTRDPLKISPQVDMEEVVDYARTKDVGLILWVNWLSIVEDMGKKLDQFKKWGIKGIKVDFMQRDDQEVVLFYEEVARESAKRKMLVDFHGSYKPTGWSRTYPNIMTSEGVYGAENNKWDKAQQINPDHNVTIPFIRMVAGPMDYTPGAMLNAQRKNWTPISDKPMSMGTRCHELAKYIVYESPLQMLADSPTHYYKEKESMDFLKDVPVEWVQTIPLEAKKGHHVALARKGRSGDWYIGAMVGQHAQQFDLNLSFLEPGIYTLQYWKDGVNASVEAQDLKTGTLQVTSRSVMKAELAPGGGWVARLIKNK